MNFRKKTLVATSLSFDKRKKKLALSLSLAPIFSLQQLAPLMRALSASPRLCQQHLPFSALPALAQVS